MWLGAVAVPSAASAQDVTAAASGEWAALAGQYIKGDAIYPLDACYEGVTQPVAKVGLEQDGVVVWEQIVLDSPGLRGSDESDCTWSQPTEVDSNLLAEGAHTYRTWTWGTNSGVAQSAPWTIFIDRTAPVFPSTISVGGRPSATGKIWVYWDAADDPVLADGNGGSGVVRYEVRLPGGAWLPEDGGGGIQIDEPSSPTTIEVRAYDRAGNISSPASAPITMLPTDPEDSVAVPTPVPQPDEDEWDMDDPALTQDRLWELEEYYGDESEGPGLAPFGEDQPLDELAAPYPPHGKHDPDLKFRCAGAWAMIQANVSGFVIGNCRGDEWVLGYKGFVEPADVPIEDWPGAPSEGRGWEAVSLPAAAHFDGCGWINIKNRLYEPQSEPPQLVNRCDEGPIGDRRHAATYEHAEFIKRYNGTRVAPADHPNSKRYDKLYIWASFGKKDGRRVEMSGKKYRPSFDDPDKTCQAYANINPYKGGPQQVLASERTFAVHDNSPNIRLRYLARFRAYDENGNLNSWVMLHSVHPTDRLQNWGFVSANCLFTD